MIEETEIEIGAAPIVEETNIDPSTNPIAEAIGAAEDIPNPLDGLVEKCAAVRRHRPGGPGAARDRAVIGPRSKCRSQLKKAGCRHRLDEAIAEEAAMRRGEARRRRTSDRAGAVGRAVPRPGQDGLADLDINGHGTWPIRARVSVAGSPAS
jgi:hypothetical protein